METSNRPTRYAVIIGAGPAGLTAAYELLTRTNIVPIVLEQSDQVGGLSRTVNYKGNRLDVGGHRFFSKSQRVINWWLQMLPLQSAPGQTLRITYQRQSALVRTPEDAASPRDAEKVMLIRDRKSRIYFRGKLFDYPISLTTDTLKKLGLLQSVRIGWSYIRSRMFLIPDEKNLEEFLINRFGRELYFVFFKNYTEKVWGVSCKDIDAAWGTQRIRGLSLTKMAAHHLQRLLVPRQTKFFRQNCETSLIEQFMYPRLGPGQMWEEVARRIKGLGGKILMRCQVDQIVHTNSQRIVAVRATNSHTGELRQFSADYVFSTMPVKELVSAMTPSAPATVRGIADGLKYRDFITVGVLCKRFALRESSGRTLQDNWIYIQEPGMLAGRLQIFNNWSPAMVADPSTVWVGVEYFCNEADELWRRNDSELRGLAKSELIAMGILAPSDILDATVVRASKAYPAYFGSYNQFSKVRRWTDRFENLFLIGRNGMHRYNNQDHSMLTAMVAVDNIVAGIPSRENLWALNTDQEYQEERSRVSNVA
ncbi:MAG TPA: NAD(P)/FAD-dependent oxidoreductase [Bryobacteraceae bacterium]|nr:NAD(P)/FAD-dependent oxidoreductase [Bryobacteraceae bacterium]